MGEGEVTDLHPSCRKCKYWESFSDVEYRPEKKGLGECTKPKPFWDCTEWDEDDKRKLKEDHKNDLMFVQDGSDYTAHLWDYTAHLWTAPDFFCACFEENAYKI